MNHISPTAPAIADDLVHTRRDVDIKSKVDDLNKAQISSARQYTETRLIVLLNRSNVLDTQKATLGDDPNSYETRSRNITKEILSLDKITQYFNIED